MITATPAVGGETRRGADADAAGRRDDAAGTPDDAAAPGRGAAISDTDADPRYPLFLDLRGRAVLVVGGGPVAARRAAYALRCGADVRVVAPSICEDLADLVADGSVRWAPREASIADVLAGPARLRGIDGQRAGQPTPHAATPHAATPHAATPHAATPNAATPNAAAPADRWWLVHTATGDPHVDSAIAAASEAIGVWCARADRAAESPAHVPAVAAGPDGVQVAVHGGGDPGRARAIRGAIRGLLATGRLPLRRTRPAAPRDTDVSGRHTARRPGAQASSGFSDPRANGGRVVLVGGGPGDPGLITVAGRQWLARADVVVVDRLGPTALLAELDPGVEVIDVGKTAGHHPIPQDEINRILVEHAEAGRTVVRLKGGDPFVLGRGGEEALHCLAHKIPVEVVPGVTSAVSVPAAAGIPVTHRGITTSFVVATAHVGAGDAVTAASSAPRDATLVLLMGLSSLPRTARELVEAGRDPGCPAAVISNGWTARQRTITGTLATIAEDVARAELPSPVVIVVGEAVRLREALGDLGVSHAADDGAREPAAHARATS